MPINGVYKVLIIDDSIPMVRCLEQILRHTSQYTTVTANNAEEGILLASTEKPDIVLLDLNLPRMNGIEACKKLKEQDITLPIIIITGELDPSNRFKAYEAGADDFVAKPFHSDQIISHLRYHLHLTSL